MLLSHPHFQPSSCSCSVCTDKVVGGLSERERGGTNPYRSSSPSLMRKFRQVPCCFEFWLQFLPAALQPIYPVLYSISLLHFLWSNVWICRQQWCHYCLMKVQKVLCIETCNVLHVTLHSSSQSSGAGLPTGNPERVKDREKRHRSSLQLLPSRPTLGIGTGTGPSNPDQTCPGLGHNRCYKPCLTVEEVRSAFPKLCGRSQNGS